MLKVLSVPFVIAAVVTAILTSTTVTARKLTAKSPIPRLVKPSVQESTNKTRLTLTAMVNYGGAIFPMGPICSEGLQLAVDAIRNASILDRYELQVEPLDDMCLRPLGIQMALGLTTNEGNYYRSDRVPLLAGTTCSQHIYIGTFLKHYNHVGIAGLTIVQEIFTKRSLYSSYFSVAPSMEIFYVAIPHLLKSNGWSKVFLLTETITYFGQLEQVLMDHLEELNITLAGTSKIVSTSGVLPMPEHMEDAVREIKAFDPRIIIWSTNNGALLACWLHRYKLYGPSYVFIANPGAYFSPNTTRYPWCSEEMLFQVLQSTIFFNFGAPPQAGSTNVTGDSLGINANFLEKTLKEKIEEPDLSSMWFLWKYLCYEEVSAAALVLNEVEKELQSKNNDTLANWVTSSQNFRSNGTYIHSIMKRHAERIHYKGLGSVSENVLNARTGVTGFLQMQLVKQPSKSISYSTALRPILVAWYDSSDPKAKLMKTGPPFIWRTRDEQPPFDSLRIFPIQDPIMVKTANLAIRIIAGVLIFVIILFLLLTFFKRKNKEVMLSIPKLNGLMLFGDTFILLFVLTLPTDSLVEAVDVSCMAASIMVVLGFSLLTSSILAKMYVSYSASAKRNQLLPTEKTNRATTGRIKTFLSRRNKARTKKTDNRVIDGNEDSSTAAARQLARQMALEKATEVGRLLFERNAQLAPPFVVIWALSQTCISIIWFGLEPIQLTKINRTLEYSTTELSLAYQHFSYACSVNSTSIYSNVFMPILAGCYMIVFLRSILLAFMLRSMKPVEEVNDLQLVRSASYTVGLAAIAGCLVIWLFFANDPGTIEMAASVLALKIVLINLLIVFATKLQKGFYL